MNDYGSFDQLPEPEVESKDPFESSGQLTPGRVSEAASLLDHDGLAEQSSHSYRSADDPSREQRTRDSWKRPKG